MIRSLFKNIKLKQALGLFSVSTVGIPLGILTSIILANYLGPEKFGDYQFIHNFYGLTVILLTLGFYQSGNRAIVLSDDKEVTREFFGAELIITFFIFLVLATAVLIYTLVDNNVQDKQLDTIILITIPFSWVFLSSRYFETLFNADNRIRLLAIYRLCPKVVFLAVMLLIFFASNFSSQEKLLVTTLSYLLVDAVVSFWVFRKLKPSFNNFQKRLKQIWYYNKTFGFNVYLGALFAVGFSQLTGVLISYYGIDNSGVGFYSLAISISVPLSFIPNILATIYYKDFSKEKKINKKLLVITVLLSGILLISLWFVVPPFVSLFYGAKFQSVASLNLIVSTGVLAHGLGDFFNRFLGAHGQGSALRNSAFLVGIVTMALNLVLIPRYGTEGAAYTRLVSGIVYLLIILTYYVRYITKLK